MGKSSAAHVHDLLPILRDALRPFVENHLSAHYGPEWRTAAAVKAALPETARNNWENDVYCLLSVMAPIEDEGRKAQRTASPWLDVFRHKIHFELRPLTPGLLQELILLRHKVAHTMPISILDACRAFDAARRLLEMIKAPQSLDAGDEIDLLRARHPGFAEP